MLASVIARKATWLLWKAHGHASPPRRGRRNDAQKRSAPVDSCKFRRCGKEHGASGGHHAGRRSKKCTKSQCFIGICSQASRLGERRDACKQQREIQARRTIKGLAGSRTASSIRYLSILFRRRQNR